MQKKIKIIFFTLLLTGGAILCATRWQVWFHIPQEPEWKGDTLAYQFVTFGLDTVPGFVHTKQGWIDTLSPHSLDILLLGDIHNNMTQADYDTLHQRHPNIDIVAQVGDWMERGQFYYYQQLLTQWLPSSLCSIPIINCPGNHEYNKGLNKTLTHDWYTWFKHPSNGPIDQKGSMYYVDFPQLRFIVIDTNPLNRVVYLTRTLTWLENAINTAGDRLVITMMHHPVISAAEGRFNTLIYATFRLALGQTDLAISGHDHTYMRQMPFLVLNTAGKNKHPKQHNANTIVSTEQAYSIISIPYHANQAKLTTFQRSNGHIIDSCYVNNRHHRSIPAATLR